MRRTDNYNLTEFDAVCLEDSQFPQPLAWPSCANGDYCANDPHFRRIHENVVATEFTREPSISVTQCIEPTDLDHSDEIETLWEEGESINYADTIK